MLKKYKKEKNTPKVLIGARNSKLLMLLWDKSSRYRLVKFSNNFGWKPSN